MRASWAHARGRPRVRAIGLILFLPPNLSRHMGRQADRNRPDEGKTWCRWCRDAQVSEDKEPAVCKTCLVKTERKHVRHWAQVKRLQRAYEHCPDLWPRIHLLIQMTDHLEAIAALECQEAVMNEPSIYPLLYAVYAELKEQMGMAGIKDPSRLMSENEDLKTLRLRQSFQQLLEGRSYSTEEMEGQPISDMIRMYGSTLN